MGLSGQPVPALAHANHGLALMGPVRDFTGLALARGNPAVPGVALTNPVRDKSGLANWGVNFHVIVLRPLNNFESTILVASCRVLLDLYHQVQLNIVQIIKSAQNNGRSLTRKIF